MLRVVFDTSTLVGAALMGQSTPRQALEHAVAHFEICASAPCLDELQRVLRRPKFDRYLPIETRRRFFDLLVQQLEIIEVPPELEEQAQPACRDAEDQKILALAQCAAAGVIVSSDEDLLCLDPWNGVRVLSPATFLALHG